jgi:nickel-dependent lactate racemase
MTLRETNLKQIGRQPNFFDMSRPIELPRDGLRIYQGFKASIQNTQMGLTVAVDKIYKCISTQTCYDKILEMKQRHRDPEKWKYAVNMEFANKSIMANWGARQTYIVSGVDFEKNLVDLKFNRQGSEISVAEYFSKMYKLEVSDLNQPLLVVKSAGNDLFLPS